jgi:FdhD protein
MEESLLPGLAPEISCSRFTDGKWQQVAVPVPREMAFSIYINSQELVTIQCTPNKLNCLVLGYLYSEGIIQDLKDVAAMRVCEDDALADVKLNRLDFALPQKRVLTSGCGGGVSFNLQTAKIDSSVTIMPEQVLHLMRQLLDNAMTYNLSGGIHTSAISDSSSILAMAEDIGRHNTLDKLVGECLLRKIPTRDKILLTSGRVSSEMLRKATNMQTPVIVSLTSPTEQAILLARQSGTTLVGYARGNHLTAYSHAERLCAPAA